MPISKFRSLFKAAQQLPNVKLPAACCLSTIGLDNYPNARFVSLKSIQEDQLIITGPLQSRKGLEISKNEKVALTFWWDQLGCQVRIQGEATLINDKRADEYFALRNRASQVVSQCSEQGKVLESKADFEKKIAVELRENEGQKLLRPEQWGIITVKPRRFEFLTFAENRLHERVLHERLAEGWKTSFLQP